MNIEILRKSLKKSFSRKDFSGQFIGVLLGAACCGFFIYGFFAEETLELKKTRRSILQPSDTAIQKYAFPAFSIFLAPVVLIGIRYIIKVIKQDYETIKNSKNE